MVDSVLYQLYEGQISPGERYKPKIEVLKKQRRACNERHHATLERLHEKEPEIYADVMQLLDEYLDEYLEVNLMEVPEMFCEGFSIGVRMMIEVFMGA